ncbi:MAG: TrkH family potassium uptake protein [Clostridiales bacterium]|nr:TrkH family potassium uptake protein [Clostridiales bacterium]
MNKDMIRYILGWILVIEGVFLLLPWIVGLIYRERCTWTFLLVSLCSLLVGWLVVRKKPGRTVFYMREGCVATAASWILISLVGCLPFLISGEIPSFVDAFFETVSGFTTTGATILDDVEALSHCMLFWRSFTHWMGGMGVLVFLLAVIRMGGGSNMNLMRAESTGPSVSKLVPKVMRSARITYTIYISLTFLMVVFLLAGRMPLFEALTTAFGTAGTGGFGVKADSIAGYSPYIQWVVTVFMLAFGVNFNAYYLILFKKWRQAFHMEEVRYYFLIILGAIVVIMVNIYDTAVTFGENLRTVSFQVASIITTTGFATVDFNLWPETSRFILVLIMFFGACAGSTGGGLKISRIVIMVKTVLREFGSYLFPKSVKKIKMDGKNVEEDVIRGIHVYLVTFVALFVLSMFCLSLENVDFITNFTAVAATINNIGPGLNMVGPTQSYSFFTNFSKIVLVFDMLAGRLELFPLLILIYPPTWKGSLKKAKS